MFHTHGRTLPEAKSFGIWSKLLTAAVSTAVGWPKLQPATWPFGIRPIPACLHIRRDGLRSFACVQHSNCTLHGFSMLQLHKLCRPWNAQHMPYLRQHRVISRRRSNMLGHRRD